jgi:AcrR family transcriptional regulator
MPRRTTSHGAKTRGAILRTAADLASVDGLDGLSIGRLATELAMSKSGLFAHFGSKEDLQLATIEEARQRYVREVIAPALASGSGITRLHALCESFLSYVERAVFPGGCFFASAMAEFDCKAPGPVRDRIAECQGQWMNTLERAARDAQAQRQLPAGSDPQQLAFELEGALLTANWYFHLYTDATYLSRARRAVRARLASEATPTGRRALRPAPQTGETSATGNARRKGSSDDEAGHGLSPLGGGGRGLGP